jgi:hypothetical protein
MWAFGKWQPNLCVGHIAEDILRAALGNGLLSLILVSAAVDATALRARGAVTIYLQRREKGHSLTKRKSCSAKATAFSYLFRHHSRAFEGKIPMRKIWRLRACADALFKTEAGA